MQIRRARSRKWPPDHPRRAGSPRQLPGSVWRTGIFSQSSVRRPGRYREPSRLATMPSMPRSPERHGGGRARRRESDRGPRSEGEFETGEQLATLLVGRLRHIGPMEQDVEDHQVHTHPGTGIRSPEAGSPLQHRERRVAVVIECNDLTIDHDTIGDLSRSDFRKWAEQIEATTGASPHHPVFGTDYRPVAIPLDLEPPASDRRMDRSRRRPASARRSGSLTRWPIPPAPAG